MPEIVEPEVRNPRLLAGALPGILEAQGLVAIRPGKRLRVALERETGKLRKRGTGVLVLNERFYPTKSTHIIEI
jgi:hypothetical protein